MALFNYVSDVSRIVLNALDEFFTTISSNVNVLDALWNMEVAWLINAISPKFSFPYHRQINPLGSKR